MSAVSVGFLWLLHGVLFHGVQLVNGSKRILRKHRVLLLMLLLTARELVLTWSPAVFCHPSRSCGPNRSSTYPNVRQCFAITVLLSGLVPRSATLSSLLTLRTRNLLDLNSSCIHKYAHPCASFCQSLVCGGCVRWPSQQSPTPTSSRNPDPSTRTQFLLTQTLPMLQHTALLLRCFLQ